MPDRNAQGIELVDRVLPTELIFVHSCSTFGADEFQREHLPRRQGLANRLRFELAEDRPQRADARRERVGVVLNDVVQFFDERGGFFV